MISNIVLVRGGGDVSTGCCAEIADYLSKNNRIDSRIIVLEQQIPSCVRRNVALSTAIDTPGGVFTVEDHLHGVLIEVNDNIYEKLPTVYHVGVLVDPYVELIKTNESLLSSISCIVDARIIKMDAAIRNSSSIASEFKVPLIGLGPCCRVHENYCDYAVETNRGPKLGHIYDKYGESPEPDTGIPGNIAGYTMQRVLWSMKVGRWRTDRKLGDLVEKEDEIGRIVSIESEEKEETIEIVRSNIHGMVRGLLSDGFNVSREHFKVGDVDPRGVDAPLGIISDKARKIGKSISDILHNNKIISCKTLM